MGVLRPSCSIIFFSSKKGDRNFDFGLAWVALEYFLVSGGVSRFGSFLFKQGRGERFGFLMDEGTVGGKELLGGRDGLGGGGNWRGGGGAFKFFE